MKAINERTKKPARRKSKTRREPEAETIDFSGLREDACHRWLDAALAAGVIFTRTFPRPSGPPEIRIRYGMIRGVESVARTFTEVYRKNKPLMDAVLAERITAHHAIYRVDSVDGDIVGTEHELSVNLPLLREVLKPNGDRTVGENQFLEQLRRVLR